MVNKNTTDGAVKSEFYSLTECARMFSSTPTTILRLTRSGQFPEGRRFGKRWLFPRTEVDKALKRLLGK